MILIVDHDPTFLENAGPVLDAGRGVLFALDANHAKFLAASIGASFSVALVDLDLRGQDGHSLICEMCQQFPDLPVIAMGGISQEHVFESANAVGAVDALRKPITPEWKTAIARVRSKAANG
jgi:FixJ family two-component response regulator